MKQSTSTVKWMLPLNVEVPHPRRAVAQKRLQVKQGERLVDTEYIDEVEICGVT